MICTTSFLKQLKRSQYEACQYNVFYASNLGSNTSFRVPCSVVSTVSFRNQESLVYLVWFEYKIHQMKTMSMVAVVVVVLAEVFLFLKMRRY